MKQTIDISLDLGKIDKAAIFESPKTGKKYLNLTLLLRDEKDQYGNDGFVVQKISKERKAAGERGPILGNGKIIDWDAPREERGSKPSYSPQIVGNDDSDIIPF
jgi:hypothetical protein